MEMAVATAAAAAAISTNFDKLPRLRLAGAQNVQLCDRDWAA